MVLKKCTYYTQAGALLLVLGSFLIVYEDNHDCDSSDDSFKNIVVIFIQLR